MIKLVKEDIEKRLLKYIPKRLQPYVVWLDYEPSSHVYFLTFEKDGVEYSPDPADDVAELAWNARQYTDILLGKKQESLTKESYRYYSDLEGLDDTTLDIIRKLDELDYYGIKPIQFGKDTLMSFSKNYFTDKVKSNGITVDIDPLNGDVTVTEFIYDVDGEDLTVLCPVKKVRAVNDVIKIDRWANNIRKW